MSLEGKSSRSFSTVIHRYHVFFPVYFPATRFVFIWLTEIHTKNCLSSSFLAMRVSPQWIRLSKFEKKHWKRDTEKRMNDVKHTSLEYYLTITARRKSPMTVETAVKTKSMTVNFVSSCPNIVSQQSVLKVSFWVSSKSKRSSSLIGIFGSGSAQDLKVVFSP